MPSAGVMLIMGEADDLAIALSYGARADLCQFARVATEAPEKSRHLETAGAGGTRRRIAYASTIAAHRFHLPGGGHQLFTAWQKGSFSWEVPGLMAIGGYEYSIPKAITFADGV